MAIISLKLVCHSCFSAGNFTRYGYDKETETCEEFNYGGCKGDNNDIQLAYMFSYMYSLLLYFELLVTILMI